MALAVYDRVRETTAVVGTNDAVLLGAVTGFQSFAVVGTTNTCYYTIADQAGNWEVGLGTYNSVGPTMERTTVLSSSAGGAKVNFPVGTKDIFLTYPAEVAVISSNNPSTAGYVLTSNGAGVAPSWQINAGGDVTGPASATDNAVARFDGTTGKIIQNSAVTIGDDGATVIAANSSSDGLRITQIGTGNALVVEDSANPDSTPFVVDGSGIVISGHTSSVLSGPRIQIVSTAANGFGAVNYSDDVNGPLHTFAKSRGTIASPTIVQSNDTISRFDFAAYDGAANIVGARITASVDGTPGTNDMPGRLVFSTTADGASNPTERMRIDSAGNFGFGSSGTVAGTSILNIKNITGATTAFGMRSRGIIQSDVVDAFMFSSFPSTQATSFTLSSLYHYSAGQNTIGAGSTVTSQFGFSAGNNLTGATNNYGFYSNIASGTGRYNFYAAGSADNYFAGKVGIGGLPYVTTQFNISGTHPGTGTINYGAFIETTIPATNTSQFYVYQSAPNTAASAFTLGSLSHYAAYQGTLGAGSAVTNQYGFHAQSSLTGATNNYGFYSNIASGTGRYNFYAGGSANNYFAGSVGVGADPGAVKLRIAGFSLFGGYGGSYQGMSIINNDDSSLAQTTSFVDAQNNLGTIDSNIFFVHQIDGGSFISLATTPAGSRSSDRRAERIRIDSAGNVGIGTSTTTAVDLRISKSITGGVGAEGVRLDGQIQSDVTSYVNQFSSVASTQAASFTLPTLKHYNTYQGTIGAGSTVTTQMGYAADSTLTGATNNYGFFSNIASGTGRYNFYAAGSADNYFAGKVGIGGTPEVTLDVKNADAAEIRAKATTNGVDMRLTGLGLSGNVGIVGTYSNHPIVLYTNATERMRIDSSGNVGIGGTPVAVSLFVAKNITGAVSTSAILSYGIVQSDTTTFGIGVNSQISTSASSFTLNNLVQYYAAQGTIGVGSAVTNQYGYLAASNFTGATNNYGFYSNIASGTGRYNFYAAGSADNYFAGSVGIGTASPSAPLAVNGAVHLVGGGAGVDRNIEIGAGRTGDGNTYVDLISDTTYTDYGARFMRFGGGGANADSGIYHRGIGSLNLVAVDAGALRLLTNNTERMRIDSSGNVQVLTGAVMPYSPAPASINTTATLTNANIQAQIINTTGTSYTVTMALGTTLETLAPWSGTNVAYDFYVVNTASGTITMAVNTGVTSVGTLTIATGVSAQFRLRRTAANTFIMYRLG